MYKPTFYCLKIGPKNCTWLIHGSKSEIKKLSGQISIIIVWYVNKQSTFTRYKFRCLFPAQLEQSKFKHFKIYLPRHSVGRRSKPPNKRAKTMKVKTKTSMTTSWLRNSGVACLEKAMTKMNLRDFSVQVCVLKKLTTPLGATKSEKNQYPYSFY